jgi:hypothetical protein
VLILGTTAFARPALADDAKGFSALKDVPAQALSATEMKSITGQATFLMSSASTTLSAIGQALATMARKQ